MLWQNASARTWATSSPSGSRSQRRWIRSRTVVAPSRCLQNAAKSCSPTRAGAAAFIARLVDRPPPGQHLPAAQRVHGLGPVGHPVGVPPPRARRTARRSPPAPRPPAARARRPPARRSAGGPAARDDSASPVQVAVHDLATRVHPGVGPPRTGQLDLRGPAAPSPARPPARPRPSAAPAARPSRGSRSRRRRRRGGSAPAHPLNSRPSGAERGWTPWQIPRSSWSPSTTPTCSLEEFQSRYATRLHPARGVQLRRGRVDRPEITRRATRSPCSSPTPGCPTSTHIFEAIHRFRIAMPTARRVSRPTGTTSYRRTRAADRHGQGQVRRLPADASGQRDEEFHNAITDLLSDWGVHGPAARGGQRQDHLADP